MLFIRLEIHSETLETLGTVTFKLHEKHLSWALTILIEIPQAKATQIAIASTANQLNAKIATQCPEAVLKVGPSPNPTGCDYCHSTIPNQMGSSP